MPNYNQLKEDCEQIEYSAITCEHLKANLIADEIHKFCMAKVVELEEISMTSKTFVEKTDRKKAFIESFLGVLNPEFTIIESEMNKY